MLAFYLALKAGELWAKAALIGGIFAALFALSLVMISRIEKRGAEKAISKIERANEANASAADARQLTVETCPGMWNREASTCER